MSEQSTLDRVATTLDIDFCRGHFPAIDSGWVFMENAGGTLVPTQVIGDNSEPGGQEVTEPPQQAHSVPPSAQ